MMTRPSPIWDKADRTIGCSEAPNVADIPQEDTSPLDKSSIYKELVCVKARTSLGIKVPPVDHPDGWM